ELHYGEVKEQLRVDWATYICSKSQFIPDKNKEYILPSTIDNLPVFLINKVITENENYPNSIHKSITFESNPLEYIYSARYVLSSVEPFTVSGTSQPKPHLKVARILAFKHSLLECVESIKLPGEKVFGKTLNENVCFVQTPSRGVFVLRMTGQIIGNEPEQFENRFVQGNLLTSQYCVFHDVKRLEEFESMEIVWVVFGLMLNPYYLADDRCERLSGVFLVLVLIEC
ncbi:2277_t:CDS:2, partial [Racocetra persica]